MRKLATLCLRLAVLLIIATGSVGCANIAEMVISHIAFEIPGAVIKAHRTGVEKERRQDYLRELELRAEQLGPLAEQGNADAQFNLGRMYQLGKGVPEDDKTAVKWYRLAAEQGHAEAQFDLGVMYNIGEGVEKDKVYAFMWYSIAASNESDYYGAVSSVLVARQMTLAQIAKAKKLTAECVRKKYKGC